MPGKTGPFGDMPLVALSHDPQFSEFRFFFPSADAVKAEDAWTEMHEELRGLASRSKWIVATGSYRYVQIYRPELVARRSSRGRQRCSWDSAIFKLIQTQSTSRPTNFSAYYTVAGLVALHALIYIKLIYINKRLACHQEAMVSTAYANSRPAIKAREALTLPQEYYSDPDYFRREMEAIHFDMWLCAGRNVQIPNAGDYFVRQVANASIVVLRDDAGQVRAFHNVCRHRGTLLCNQPEGKLSGRIQCPYHAWTYKLDGTLANAPHMDKVEGFREADYPLNSVSTAIWDGHIFINLSDRPIPFAEHLAGLDSKFRPWHMQELELVERRIYSLKANWKLIIQNYSECLHCPIVHPQLQKNSHYMSGDNEPPHPTFLGGRMDLREGVKTLTMSGFTNRACLPGVSAADQRHVYYYCLLPNFLLNLHPDYMLTFTMWPRTVDRTDIICEWHFHPDEVRKPGFDPKDAMEFWELTNQQDWELSERAQEGISSKGYRPGPYSNREELLLALDRFVLDRVSK